MAKPKARKRNNDFKGFKDIVTTRKRVGWKGDLGDRKQKRSVVILPVSDYRITRPKS